MGKQRPGTPARQPKVSRKQAEEAREELAAGGLTHQERRKLRAVTGTWDAVARRRRREVRHLVIVAAGAIAAMAIVAGVVGLVAAIQAAGGQGAAGTFVQGNQVCVNLRYGCAWSGTFRLHSGGTVQHVVYAGTLPAGTGPGMGVPAIQPAGSHTVYPPHGSDRWITDVGLMVLVGALVGLLLWLSPLGLRDHDPRGAIV